MYEDPKTQLRWDMTTVCRCHGCEGCKDSREGEGSVCWNQRASKKNPGPNGWFHQWCVCHICGPHRHKQPLVLPGQSTLTPEPWPPTLQHGPPGQGPAIVRPPGLPGPGKSLQDAKERIAKLEEDAVELRAERSHLARSLEDAKDRIAELEEALEAARAHASENACNASAGPPPPVAPPTQPAASSSDPMGSVFAFSLPHMDPIAAMEMQMRGMSCTMTEMSRQMQELHGENQEMKATIEMLSANLEGYFRQLLIEDSYEAPAAPEAGGRVVPEAGDSAAPQAGGTVVEAGDTAAPGAGGTVVREAGNTQALVADNTLSDDDWWCAGDLSRRDGPDF